MLRQLGTLATAAALAFVPAASHAAPLLDPDGYTIQLIALPSAERLQSFVRERDVSGLIATRVVRDGEPHYVLLLGSFATRERAAEAAAALPEPLRDLTPWVRPIAGLQAGTP